MHDIQKKILGTLLFREKSRFSELNIDKMSNDRFTFHIKRLMQSGLVIKDKSGFYVLSAEGKEYANRLDTDSEGFDLEKQAKIGALMVCTKSEGSCKKYLIQQRLKQPYYGFYGFLSGKIKWGEMVYEAAARELKEEAGLEGEFRFAGIEHKIDYSKKGELLEDKYFYIFEVSNCKGDLIKEFEGGKNAWMSKKELEQIPELFDDVLPIIDLINKNKLTFLEKKYTVSRY